MTGPTAAERVARGAVMLDERKPRWAERIDTGRLGIYRITDILAQLWAGHHECRGDAFISGLEELGLGSDYDAMVAHGFMIPRVMTVPPWTLSRQMYRKINDAAWAELAGPWLAEICRRTGGES